MLSCSGRWMRKVSSSRQVGSSLRQGRRYPAKVHRRSVRVYHRSGHDPATNEGSRVAIWNADTRPTGAFGSICPGGRWEDHQILKLHVRADGPTNLEPTGSVRTQEEVSPLRASPQACGIQESRTPAGFNSPRPIRGRRSSSRADRPRPARSLPGA